MMQIAVCDDELCFVEQIQSILLSQAKGLPCAIRISTYTGSGQLLYDVEDGAHFDLLFLDIEMPEKDGLSLAGCLRRCLPAALIVFITSHTEYAVKAYELSIFRYIPKSELETLLPLALKDACQLLKRNSHDTYVIESARMVRKILADDILYICKDGKYSVIVLENEQLPVRKPLEQVLHELNGPGRSGGFLMAERGYIVNLFHVEKMEENAIYLDNKVTVPVSRRNQKDVRDSIISYWRARL